MTAEPREPDAGDIHPEPGAAPGESPRGTDRSSIRVSAWNLLLLVPLLMLITAWYNNDGPRLFGMPFFYWYQFVFVFVGVACVAIVYVATRHLGEVRAGTTARRPVGRSDREASRVDDRHTVEFIVFAVLFVGVAGMGFMASPVEGRRHHGPPGRMGTGRPQVRRLDHLVPGRRRPLHRLHLRRGAGAGVRRRRHRLLRAAVHGRSSTRSCSCRCCGSGRCRGRTAT